MSLRLKNEYACFTNQWPHSFFSVALYPGKSLSEALHYQGTTTVSVFAGLFTFHAYWFLVHLNVQMQWHFTDPRFQPEFRRFYRWNDGLGRYNLGWELNLEVFPGRLYPARSSLECVALCQSLKNCTGAEFIHGEHLCHALAYQNTTLPWSPYSLSLIHCVLLMIYCSTWDESWTK